MTSVRFLLDEHVWAGLVELGKKLGADIVRVQEAVQAGIPDDEVLAFAAHENRILLTANTQDFAPLAVEWFLAERHHSGIINVPGQTQHGLLVSAMTNLIQNVDPKTLENTLRFIQEFIPTPE